MPGAPCGHSRSPGRLRAAKLIAQRRLTVHLKVAVKTLTSTLELNSNELAYVVNDNLGDSCQRMS
jgi:hypothetical protein